MTQVEPQFHSRRFFLTATSVAAVLQFGCAKDALETDANIQRASKTFKMGERASVGLLTYSVLESTYFTQLGDQGKVRLAEKRFLVIRLSITNGGGKEAEIPLFRLVDNQGVETPELQEAEFLSGWFGIIRKVGPTMTEEGRILFDVTPKNYKLEVSDGGETGKEQLAFIEIPMDFDTAEPIPAAGQGIPSAPAAQK
ncbi:DUF4352 domain-containing protein [Bryobacter aggregatus]|uniref:DUF4352 domain-containing protein n=1 Tax=Bryobacter aggregatus TaxID=360054 RepID=UPI0004E1A6F6|nr:DUF4352 domain-containing protein [Bryobacter aggregatus]